MGNLPYTSLGKDFKSVLQKRNTRLRCLASLPTPTPESAGLCALGPIGTFDPVTAHQWSGLVARYSKVLIAPFSQVLLFLHLMVAVRRAPSGAPVSWIPGRLTCVQLPPLV